MDLLQGLLVFITGAFLIQAHCVNKHGSQNFQEIVRELLGPGAYIATQLIIVLYMFICTVAYMIVIGDQLEKGNCVCSRCYTVFVHALSLSVCY